MRRRFFPSIPQSITVFAFWLLLVDVVDMGHVMMALLLAIVLPWVSERLEREFARLGQLHHLPKVLLMLLWDIVKANVTVARQVLGPNDRLQSQFVWVPLELTNIHGISALASIITLTPGTLSTELSEDRKYLLIHCLNVDDPEALIAEIKTRYEAPIKKVFP
ncbi:Na+/H+ antiporter subunit E [Lysobacteraceae bacterium NML75-0749]|nr:Na+/H+ antiporter subunit E [Xanthomonadaceae bacterium NML75-0749]PJK03770.1 Na+/H+ antiporter subunit E [Xanthomonadaceae bacterium NML71-0210]PJK04522.1 Na+/H+ antiporter subunit E [Xanthomonadaceae bacterium NML91-0268]